MWGQSSYVDAFVHDSLLDSNGVISKHLRDAIRTFLVTFKFAIDSIFNDVHVIIYFVCVLRLFRIFAYVIVFVCPPTFCGSSVQILDLVACLFRRLVVLA